MDRIQKAEPAPTGTSIFMSKIDNYNIVTEIAWPNKFIIIF